MKKNVGNAAFAYEKDNAEDEVDEDPLSSSSDRHGLLSSSKTPNSAAKMAMSDTHAHHHHGEIIIKMDWYRLVWLGLGLFLTLFAFWLLDSLKDPILGALCENNLERHQPPAKLFSVCTTLCLVLFLEYIAQERKRKKSVALLQLQELQGPDTTNTRSDDDVLNGGGHWSRMKTTTTTTIDHDDDYDGDDHDDDRVPASIFASIGLPYCLTFGIMAYLLQFHATVAALHGDPSTNQQESQQQQQQLLFAPETTRFAWHVLGYFIYAAIESFGSLMVAAFWSFTNSTLSLHECECMYGPIVAIAQLGAIAGATMVSTNVWPKVTLIITACLVICLHVIVMTMYSRVHRFRPSNTTSISTTTRAAPNTTTTASSSLFSGLHLILKHNYVLFILGASCLYEISLTCLNYQMTLLGWSRFEQERQNDTTTTTTTTMTFTQFMGHYGQMVNISSLLLSSLVFPCLMRRIGLRLTLVLFPTFLFCVNILAFLSKAVRGNLTFLFISIALLKAMTYSIHDPSTELLYLPTHSSIKFQSKFWIDVVGRRIAKAMGSTINTMSGNVARSIQVASAPSLLTALGLVLVCFRVGREFEALVENGVIVGATGRDDRDQHHRPPPSTDEYEAFGLIHHDDDDDDNDNHGDDESSNARGGGNLFKDARAPILELTSTASNSPTAATKKKGVRSVAGERKSLRSSAV
jgi:ATP/ADP translocase